MLEPHEELYLYLSVPLPDIPLEDVLVKGAIITTIIQCTGVWFAGSKYGSRPIITLFLSVSHIIKAKTPSRSLKKLGKSSRISFHDWWRKVRVEQING